MLGFITGITVSLRPTQALHWVQDKSRLHSKNLSQKTKTKKDNDTYWGECELLIPLHSANENLKYHSHSVIDYINSWMKHRVVIG